MMKDSSKYLNESRSRVVTMYGMLNSFNSGQPSENSGYIVCKSSQALKSAAIFTFGNSYLSMVLLIAMLMS